MNKFTIWLFAFALFLSQNEMYATEYYNDNAQQLVSGAEVVVTDDETNQIQFVRLSDGHEQHLSGGIEWLKNVLETPAEVDFVLYEKNADKIGYTHFRYYQTYKGVRIENAVYYLHTQASMIKSANGDYFNEVSLPSVEANITSAQAKANAKSIIKNQGIWYDDITDNTKLVIVKHKNSYKLAYKVDIYAENPLSRYFLFIDANSGRELYRIDRIHHSDSRGTAVTRYNGTKTITTDSVSSNLFRLQETGRGNGIRTYDLNTSTSYFNAIDFTDSDNYWNTTTNYDDAAYDVHYGSEVTYDFFFNNYSRNSYNNSGAVINSYVHYGSNYANAFWDGSRLTYGDGDGVNTTPLTSIDVVAHEITHAVTQSTANLIYSYESGALNESFSDILGIAVDFYANPTSANYLMGEQFNVNGTPIRSMINPNAHGHPDTYLGTHWYTGSLDNGGVHTNSGVQNYWFYLLTNGGSGVNDVQDTFFVSPLGISKATDIAYRNLTVYLTPSSQYSDARFYAIQSATDLYGFCSNEVINTTNAWHAVGVGAEYSNGVVASFYSSNTYSCESPATITFANASTNGSTYRWDFGDGDTSNLQNPTHTYTLPGNYTVTLIVNGTSTCNSSDTLQLANYINVTTVGRPKSPSCSPSTTNASSYGLGIFHFSLDSINNSSLGGIEGYQDYSCSEFTTVTEGNLYNVNITTGINYGENVKVWIDLNNDSSFNMTNELVYVSDSQMTVHSGAVVIPPATVYNTPLRLRVMSDYQGTAHNSSCSSPTYGQVEDYSISIIQNTNPPLVDFQANKTSAGQGETVQFTDMSQNVPTSWSWSFPGGTPSSSTLQNPAVSYSSSGSYDVSLIVSNAYGSDTITRSNYMSIVSIYTMCVNNNSSATSGTLFDSGGPTGNYSNNENCSFLINSPCANSVTLSFNSFSLEGCCDYFRVYDGTSTSGTLLLTANGTSLPPSVTANSGSMYITFSSDYSVTRSGWEANWVSQVANIKPVANFTMSSTNPPFATDVSFQDHTTVYPSSWLWNFGDGDTSHVQNPMHKYTSSGNFTTTLISTNCADSDTISKTLTVQSPPLISIDSNHLRASVPCGDSINLQFKIKNLAGGDLVYESKANNQATTNNFGKIEVLALTLGTDMSREYPNTISAINQYFNNYNLTALNTTDSTVLRSALAGKDLLLIPEVENNVRSSYLNFTQVIQDFVSGGGELIFCGTGASNNTIIFNTGLFSGTYLNTINPGYPLVNASPNHYLIDSITTAVTSQSATFLYDITNPNKESVLTYSSNDIVVTRTYGSGRVTLIGFDFYNYSNENARIIANAVKNASNSRSNNWLIANNVKDTLSAVDSSTITVSLNASGVFAGIYRDTIEVISNDSINSVILIPVELTVEGQANIQTDKDSVIFSQTQVGASASDSLTIMNQGCDTLMIDSLIFSSIDYSTSINSITIPPFEETKINVDFAPTVIKTYADSLSIFSQDTTKSVAILGVGMGAPDLSYSPSSIIDTISVCGDSIIVPLTVYNFGQGDLNVKFNYNAASSNSNMSNKQVLVIKDSNPWGSNVNATILSAMGANVTIINSSQISATTFSNYDLIVMESGQSTTYYSNYLSEISKFDTYLFNGGKIHFCNTSYLGLQFPGGSLRTSNISQYRSVNYPVNLSHPLHDSCSGSYTGSSASHNYLTNLPVNGSQILIENSNSLPTAVEVAYGSGKMIAFGMPLEHMYINNYSCTKLIENSFRYLLDSGAGWLNLSTDSLNVPINDSSIINVTLNGSGLSNGTYTTSIIVESNDPLKNHDTIDVIMHIDALAELELDTLINFQSTTQYVAVIDSTLIRNPGCDTLQITNISSSSSFFTPDTNQLQIAPNDSVWLTIEFLPTTVGSFSETMTLINSVNDTTIHLTATSIQAPEITISPSPIIYDTIFNCGDSITSNFTIYNTGGGTLNWYLQNNISMDDDFESGLNTNLWSTNTGTISPSCGTNNGTGALYFGNGGSRYVETQNLDLRNGARIEFYLKYGASGYPCESLDNGEEVSLLYSTNNGVTWSQISTYQRFVHRGSFVYVNDTIPQAAQSSNTKLRLIQSSNSGSSYDHWAIDDVSISSYGFEEYIKNVHPDSGNIIATDSSIVSIEINSLGLNAGNYLKTIYVSSNDPLKSLDSVQLNLTVFGSPQISLSDSCMNFGSLVANDDKTDSILFVNPGCENLIISGAIVGSAAYSLISHPDTIYPLDTSYVIVNYNPTTVGVNNSYLRLFNNFKDTTICLLGNSVPAPVIDLNPDSMQLTMNACDDSITFPISIRNIGGSDLTYSVNGGSSDTINILALTYGTDYYEEYANTKQVINSQLNKYNLTELNSTNSAVIQAALNGVDVVLIPEIENGLMSSFTNYATPLQNFVSNGGSVIFCGSYSSNSQAVFNTGLLSGFYRSASSSYYVNSFVMSHPIVDSIPLPFYTTSGTYAYEFTNPNIVSLLKSSTNDDIIAYRELGLGKVVYIGFDFYSYNTSTSVILGNAFKWVGGGALPSWLELTNTQDTISSSDSVIMDATIFGKNLSIGSHSYNLIINNNDPTNDSVVFPININVVATPCADFGFNKPNVCSGIVNFSDSTSNSPTSWLWDFGDGSSTSTQQSPTHSYANAGVYQVTLVATNTFGSDTIVKSVTVNKMVADFTVGSPLVTNQFISFTSNSPGAISWNWNFGNGASGSGQSLSYSYSLPGSYNVTLITTNGFNCKDTITKLVQIIAVGLEEKNVEGFEIYPNPNDGNFIVKTGGQLKIEEIVVYNNLGQLIYSKLQSEVVNNDKVELHDKAKGIYLVKVKLSSGKTVQRKIIVQ